jgi:hypothetical protein
MKLSIKLFLILLLSSCSSGYIVTTNLHDLASFEENSYIYALPKTRLVVKVTASKTEFIPGPYHQYAKVLLGIEGARVLSSVHYQIQDIQLISQSIPDSDYCYSVKDINYGKVEELLKDLKAKGLVMEDFQPGYSELTINDLDALEPVQFTDLSVKPFIHAETTKTGNSNVEVNSSGMPFTAKQLEAKSLEEKANEAAKFIIKIRKRRFKLLAGQYEVFPEGIALATAVEELTKLEEEYLSLFIGKTSTSIISQSFMAIPSEGEKVQRFTLFRFSNESGFYAAGGKNGEAVILQLKDLETNSTLSQLQRSSLNSQNDNKLYYRLADRAEVKVFYGSHEVLEAELAVFQFGAQITNYVPPVPKKLF